MLVWVCLRLGRGFWSSGGPVGRIPLSQNTQGIGRKASRSPGLNSFGPLGHRKVPAAMAQDPGPCIARKL